MVADRAAPMWYAHSLVGRPIRLGWLCLALAACGGGSGAVDPVDGGAEAGPTDAAPDAVPDFDAGAPPPCDLEPFAVTFAEGFDRDRRADPSDFTGVEPGGPWAYTYRWEQGVGAELEARVEVRVVNAAGAAVGTATLDSRSGAEGALQNLRLRPAASGFFAVWAHTTHDAGGQLTDSEIRHAAVATDAVVVRDVATLYESSAAPFLASSPPDDVWVLRSEITPVGSVTAVEPHIQHLDGVGDPKAADKDLRLHLSVEASEVTLRVAPSRLQVVYREPPSTLRTLPLERDATPVGRQGRVVGVPFVDDAVATDEAVAVGWSEILGGQARVGVAVVSASGEPRANAMLDERAAGTERMPVAVVEAWPAFVAVWRAGEGDDAVLRGAGIDPWGRVLVGPVDLVAVPGAAGDLFATSDGARVTVGYRAVSDGAASLGFARTCGPR